MYAAVFVLFALLTKYGSAWSPNKPEFHRIVDLTHVFDNTTVNIPLVRRFEMNKILLEVSGVRAQLEEYCSSTQVGTNINSPCFFFAGGKTVNEIPLDRLIAPAAVVDIRHKAASNPGYELQIEDLLQWEDTTGVLLNDVILLVHSGWSKYWSCNTTAYLGTADNNIENFLWPGITPSAAVWLAKNRHVYGVGIDTFAVDSRIIPGVPTTSTFLKSNIYVVENMDDMSNLPLFGATLYVMPMKIGGACAAPTRIVATIPEKHHVDYRSANSEDMNLLERKYTAAE